MPGPTPNPTPAQGLPQAHRLVVRRTQIQDIVEQLADEITVSYRHTDLVLVGILTGALYFLADLSRLIRTPHEIMLIRGSSYGSAQESSGQVEIQAVDKDLLSLEGKHVLIVDDICDTGLTLHKAKGFVGGFGPAKIETCALLYKSHKRGPRPTYIGVDIPDWFVIGYGMGLGEKFRHLPDIVRLDPGGA